MHSVVLSKDSFRKVSFYAAGAVVVLGTVAYFLKDEISAVWNMGRIDKEAKIESCLKNEKPPLPGLSVWVRLGKKPTTHSPLVQIGNGAVNVYVVKQSYMDPPSHPRYDVITYILGIDGRTPTGMQPMMMDGHWEKDRFTYARLPGGFISQQDLPAPQRADLERIRTCAAQAGLDTGPG